MMKSVIIAAAFAITATPALAGGFGGPKNVTAPQFANASALNLAIQAGGVHSKAKGKMEQLTGAAADAINKSECHCEPGLQAANAKAKNVSIQAGSVSSWNGRGVLNQSAVSTAISKNIRGSKY